MASGRIMKRQTWPGRVHISGPSEYSLKPQSGPFILCYQVLSNAKHPVYAKVRKGDIGIRLESAEFFSLNPDNIKFLVISGTTNGRRNGDEISIEITCIANEGRFDNPSSHHLHNHQRTFLKWVHFVRVRFTDTAPSYERSTGGVTIVPEDFEYAKFKTGSYTGVSTGISKPSAADGKRDAGPNSHEPIPFTEEKFIKHLFNVHRDYYNTVEFVCSLDRLCPRRKVPQRQGYMRYANGILQHEASRCHIRPTLVFRANGMPVDGIYFEEFEWKWGNDEREWSEDSIGPPSTPSESVVEPLCLVSHSVNRRSDMIGAECPLLVSKASMQYLYDETGKEHLDCISNGVIVGHCHPTVVSSISNQLANSTCNVRFVSPVLTECAEQILATLPGMDTVIFVNSGSEAYDLALHISRDYTEKYEIIVGEHSYDVVNGLKCDRDSSNEWVHVAPCPDVFRGIHRLPDAKLRDEVALAEKSVQYSDEVKTIIQKAECSGRGIAMFISEALQSCGGQVVPPAGYFQDVAKHVRAHGGLVVIDESRGGFGRVGKKFWAHQMYEDGFVPDIVTMGKPMGNGFPVSAVVTRRAITDKLGGDVGYFNTYGGNPVACSAVLGVLKVIREENLVVHSQRLGDIFKVELAKVKADHSSVIGDIRGVGLFWGLDLVKDLESREPNSELAAKLIVKARQELGVLLSADGPHSNIIKLKPPLCFNEENLHEAVAAIDRCLTELGY